VAYINRRNPLKVIFSIPSLAAGKTELFKDSEITFQENDNGD